MDIEVDLDEFSDDEILEEIRLRGLEDEVTAHEGDQWRYDALVDAIQATHDDQHEGSILSCHDAICDAMTRFTVVWEAPGAKGSLTEGRVS